MTYDVKPISAPRAAGPMLRALVAALENPVTGGPLIAKLFRDMGVIRMRASIATDPLPIEHPLHAATPPASRIGARPLSVNEVSSALPAAGPTRGFAFETAAQFVEAYRSGRVNPGEVAQRVLEQTRASQARAPAMSFFIAQDGADVTAQAHAATERYRSGDTLGPLDGVPVAVKDELDAAGYRSTVGTRFLGRTPVAHDAECVARLRRAGAVIIGKTNMHEIGLGVTGLNPHHGSARNPYDPTRATGGSSSGSAAVVAAGLCPIAVGADGGGSIRTPASFCGVAGLKATFGRVSEHGAAELCWSVGHVGPIAASVRDLALAYGVMAGPDERDPGSLKQPTPRMDGLAETSLRGIRLGLYRAWFDDAQPDVVANCRAALELLRSAGADIVEIEIPELSLLRTVHMVTIVSEMAAAHERYYADHRRDYGLDVRANLALARALRAYDYVHASRLRVRLSKHFANTLSSVDAIITPTTGRTAPALALDALETGESNTPVLDEIMRFAMAGNLTGVPAITVPAGYDRDGMPVGVQLMGRAWEEHVLLRMAAVIERGIERRAPRVHYRLLA